VFDPEVPQVFKPKRALKDPAVQQVSNLVIHEMYRVLNSEVLWQVFDHKMLQVLNPDRCSTHSWNVVHVIRLVVVLRAAHQIGVWVSMATVLIVPLMLE
jgi:hypothetical protein